MREYNAQSPKQGRKIFNSIVKTIHFSYLPIIYLWAVAMPTCIFFPHKRKPDRTLRVDIPGSFHMTTCGALSLLRKRGEVGVYFRDLRDTGTKNGRRTKYTFTRVRQTDRTVDSFWFNGSNISCQSLNISLKTSDSAGEKIKSLLQQY